MTTRPVEESWRREVLPRRTRFVLVNERSPRTDACCTWCSAAIERGYVRDSNTRLLYCDTQCFTQHEKA